MGKQNKFIFLHLGRTGGTTLRVDVLLRQFLPEQVFGVDVSIADAAQGTYADLFNLPEPRKRQLHLIVGHMPFGAAAHMPDPENWHYITFLRHPVARTISEYYQVKNDLNNPAHVQAKQFGLRAFVERGLGLTWNGMARSLSNQVYGQDYGSDDEMYAAALCHLDQCRFVGSTELFPACVAELCRRFGWRMPELSQHHRLTPANKVPTAAELAAILQANEYDLRLYQEYFGAHAARPGPGFRSASAIGRQS